MLRVLICLISSGLSPLSGLAAPWTQEDDALYARTSVSVGQLQGAQVWRSDVYAEYGVAESWTLSLKGASAQLPNAFERAAHAWRISARKRIFQVSGFVSSVEAAVFARNDIGAPHGCDSPAMELRGGAGWSGRLPTGKIYSFAEVAIELDTPCPVRRLDLGLGYQLTDRISILNQLWHVRGAQSAPSDKFQIELVWQGRTYEYSVGYNRETGGAFAESGVVIAWTGRF